MKNQLIILVLTVFFFSVAFIQPLFELKLPNHFPETVYDFQRNLPSKEKITLGRFLFYDPILSSDGSISCASCHSPYNAFAHTDHDLSHGIHDSIGKRNAPALFNLAWQQSFMWDGAINHLDMQALAPINHPAEMDEDIKNVVHKLQNDSFYPPLFSEAFGDSLITGERILKALSQFQLTLISANSKYDRVKKGADHFTEQEEKGYALFQLHCNSCHTEPLFTNGKFANNGLPIDSSLQDFGRWEITKQKSDRLSFKIPSLRNLSYTYPYMHDGRFRKLHQVINHYANDVHSSPSLADELEGNIQLHAHEKIDLTAFLLTLDDKKFVFHSAHQFPRQLIPVFNNRK